MNKAESVQVQREERMAVEDKALGISATRIRTGQTEEAAESSSSRVSSADALCLRSAPASQHGG